MLDYLRYVWLRCKHPRREDFLRMGFGILSRSKRARRYWQGHLRNCRDLQEISASGLTPESVITILGAGRLLDVDLTRLAANQGTIHLFDLDPGVQGLWRLAARRLPHTTVVPHLCDLTQVIDRWTDELESFITARRVAARQGSAVAAVAELALFLDGLKLESIESLSRLLPASDLVVSQNLLSQIPIYWRDRVQAMVLKRWGLDTNKDGEFDPILQQALERTMARLEQQHLDLLAHSKAAKILLITDRRFYYYRRDISPWQEHRALSASTTTPIVLSGYTITVQRSWLWHLVPQGIESQEYGEIHEVWGAVYEAKTDPHHAADA